MDEAHMRLRQVLETIRAYSADEEPHNHRKPPMSSDLKAAETVLAIDPEECRYTSEFDGSAVDGCVSLDDEELEAAQKVANAYLELAALVTDEVRRCAAFHQSYIEFDGDRQVDVGRSYESRRKLADFALAVIEKLEAGK